MDILLKIGATLLVIIVCLFPTGLFLLLNYLLSPTGFWENVVVIGVGLYFLLGLQIIFLIIMARALLTLWE